MPTATIRNDTPSARLRNTDSPFARSQKTSPSEITIAAGTPIGLLLALTYAVSFTILSANISPFARIRNTD